jgi:hypothetical protein
LYSTPDESIQEGELHARHKARSKSPHLKSDGEHPKNYLAQKVKKFYKFMVPAFTNKKREASYNNTPK